MGPPLAAARCKRIIRNRRHGGDGRSDPNRRRPAARNSGRPMDIATARSLIDLNNRFYARNAASFSATRSAPWAGWRALSELLAQHGWLSPDDEGTGASKEHRVLDLACGNLRFERFLADEFPKLDLRFLAVDSCAELACDTAAGDIDCTYRQIDVLQALLDCDENTPGSACPAVAITPGSTCPAAFVAPGYAPAPEAGPTFDLCASFGFMHHVPGEHLRRRLLDRLLDCTSPGGLLAMSFWQFMSDDRLSRKADQADSAMRAQGRIDMARLDANDHFLGWQTDPSPLRYCHHFDEREIDELVASVGTRAREVARYSADGSSGTLNRYLVLERLA